MQTMTSRLPLPALAVVATLAAGAGFLLNERPTASPAPARNDVARELSRAFRDVAQALRPSVVSVVATVSLGMSDRTRPSERFR